MNNLQLNYSPDECCPSKPFGTRIVIKKVHTNSSDICMV